MVAPIAAMAAPVASQPYAAVADVARRGQMERRRRVERFVHNGAGRTALEVGDVGDDLVAKRHRNESEHDDHGRR